jgi:hypothetical protein
MNGCSGISDSRANNMGHQSSGQSHDLQICNKYYKIVAKLKYLGTAVTIKNENSIHEEIKSRLNSGNICYYSVQNLLFSCLLYKNLKD